VTIRHRRLATAFACLAGFALSAFFLVQSINHLDSSDGRNEWWEDLLYCGLGLFFVCVTAPGLLKPFIVRLTPEFLEVSRTLTHYRIPWDEIEDAIVARRGQLPCLELTTDPPRSTWAAQEERKTEDCDLAIFWWEVSVPMNALAKLLWLYAADPAARTELNDSRKVSERLDALRKRA
jgi:hypothetical protein